MFFSIHGLFDFIQNFMPPIVYRAGLGRGQGWAGLIVCWAGLGRAGEGRAGDRLQTEPGGRCLSNTGCGAAALLSSGCPQHCTLA